MNIEEALQYIHSVSWKGTIPGLERELELLKRLGDPQDALKFVHIAGTNGKGSTAAMIASVLTQAGYRTGLYTSPYIVRFNERIQVDGVQISDDDLCAITEYVRPHAEAMAEHPTEFEMVTAIGFEYFRRAGCDIVVLEVGMGGEWDATNVVNSTEAAVLTNIGLDHTNILGNTVWEIARTKSGIIKPGRPCVLYQQQASVEMVVEEICRERCAPLCRVDFSALSPVSDDLKGQRFHWHALKDISIPLLGDHQLKNACTALTTLMVLRGRGWVIPDAAIREGLANTAWPGRFQVLMDEPLFIVDGGHNPQCLEALRQAIEKYLHGKRIVFLVGCMADKDYAEMFRYLMPYADSFVTVTPNNPRALGAEALSAYLTSRSAGAQASESLRAGVKAAIAKAGSDGVVCACGSLYMIGDIIDAVEAYLKDKA